MGVDTSVGIIKISGLSIAVMAYSHGPVVGLLFVFFIIFRSIWELVKTAVASVGSIIYRVYQTTRVTQKSNPAYHVIA